MKTFYLYETESVIKNIEKHKRLNALKEVRIQKLNFLTDLNWDFQSKWKARQAKTFSAVRQFKFPH